MAPGDHVRDGFTVSWQVRAEPPRTFLLQLDGPARVAIGRSADSDVMVDHPTISRRHAELELRDGRCWLRDLDSTYGTRVNGTRISDPVLLHAGDAVMLGGVQLAITEPGPTGPALVNDEDEFDLSATIVRPIATLAVEATAHPDASPSQAARLLSLLSQITRSLVQPRVLADVLDGVGDLVFEPSLPSGPSCSSAIRPSTR